MTLLTNSNCQVRVKGSSLFLAGMLLAIPAAGDQAVALRAAQGLVQ